MPPRSVIFFSAADALLERPRTTPTEAISRGRWRWDDRRQVTVGSESIMPLNKNDRTLVLLRVGSSFLFLSPL